MGIDASIYSNIQPVQTPDIAGAMQKGMNLSQLAMQNQQAMRSMQQQQAMRQAYAQNTDPNTGQVNKQGVLSSLGKMGMGQLTPELGESFAKQDKASAEAQSAKMDAVGKIVDQTLPKMNYLKQLPEDKRAQAFPIVMAQLEAQGVPMNSVPKDEAGNFKYDPDHFDQTLGILNKTSAHLAQVKTQAETGKIYSEIGDKQRGVNTDYQKMLLGDEQYKKASGMLSEGKNAMAAIDDAVKNPGSAANIPIMLARFTSAGSRMNENEIEANIKSGGFGDQLKQMYTKSKTGTLDPQMADFARQYLTTQMQSAAKNKGDAETDIAGKYAVATGMPKGQAYSRLTASQPGTLAQVPQGPGVDRRLKGGRGGDMVQSANAADVKQAPAGTIAMRAPNGKIKYIPLSQKGEAIAAGGEVVK